MQGFSGVLPTLKSRTPTPSDSLLSCCSDLLERVGRPVAQAEEVADGVEDRVGVVVVRLGGGRADGGAGVVEELVLEPHHRVRDRLAVGVAQVAACAAKSLSSSRRRIGVVADSPSCLEHVRRRRAGGAASRSRPPSRAR